MPLEDKSVDQPDQKPSTPQRLQSLSTRGGRGGLRGGRFLPKAVGRRSKEDRESSAPALKPQQPSPEEGNDRGNDRGKPRFDRRKQRQLGTRAEAAGPLAAPTIMGPSRPMKSSGSAMAAGSTAGHGGPRVKTEHETNLSASFISDVRIDLSSLEDRADHFPLRMPVDTASASKDPKIAGENAVSEAPGEAEEKIEEEEAGKDRVQIEDGQIHLLQLPELGLENGKPPSTSPLFQTTASRNHNEVNVKSEIVDTHSGTNKEGEDATMDQPTSEPLIASAGRLGTLRRHKSGKLSLQIGDNIYDLITGTHGGSSEQLLVLNDSSNEAISLGSVKSRVLAVPDLDSLHI